MYRAVPPIGEAGHERECPGTAPTNDNWDATHRCRHLLRFAQCVVLARIGDLFTRPKSRHNLKSLGQALDAGARSGVTHAKSLKLGWDATPTNTQLEAA